MAIWESIGNAVLGLAKDFARSVGTTIGIKLSPAILRGLTAYAPNFFKYVEII